MHNRMRIGIVPTLISRLHGGRLLLRGRGWVFIRIALALFGQPQPQTTSLPTQTTTPQIVKSFPSRGRTG